RPSFRHLSNILQIHNGDKDAALEYYKDQIKTPPDEKNFHQRADCVLNWLKLYAPEDFKFKLNTNPTDLALGDLEKKFLGNMGNFLKTSWNDLQSDQELHQKIYDLAKEIQLEPKNAFRALYLVLISKEKGPKLAGFMRIIGYSKIQPLLAPFLS
ncbi:MAG: lysine--tRNA ligase, partial [Halobacteriovoraceae bacterium]|nr:lysine--tRNA ligase [Halobacteriovoraceae bacterium]